ncbi:MAG TPA: hypothetical protein VF119_00155, partial [Candidatus Limnocylindrales bacterium]
SCLSLLFLARVLGQVIVVLWHPDWLPPMEQWYSGVLAYPRLLATQVLILAGMLAVILGLFAGTGWAVGPHDVLGPLLLWVAWIYALSMVVRYVVRMTRRPDQRWLGGIIPIAFHVVLAGWSFVLASQWRPPA